MGRARAQDDKTGEVGLTVNPGEGRVCKESGRAIVQVREHPRHQEEVLHMTCQAPQDQKLPTPPLALMG